VTRCCQNIAVFLLLVVSVTTSTAVLPADSSRGHVSRTRISGVSRFSETAIQRWVRGPDGTARIAREYAGKGYWWATIRDSTRKTATGPVRTIVVREGPRGSLSLETTSGVRDTTRLGDVITPDEVAGVIDGLLRKEANRGYPFAVAEVMRAYESPGTMRLSVRVMRGPHVHISSVRPVGNAITKSHVITRELRFGGGRVYDQREVDRWRKRLIRTGYFASVDNPGLAWRDSTRGNADLFVRVLEGRPNRFEGIVGYQPGATGQKGTFTGLVNMQLGNLWGTGRRLSLQWRRPQAATTTLNLSYREPWVAGLPADLEGAVALEQRTGYALEKLSLSLGGEIVPDLSVSAGIGREIARSDSIALLGGPRHRGWSLNGSVRYDTRDNLLNPTTGVHYAVSGTWTRLTNRVNDADFKLVYGSGMWPENETYSRVRVDLEHYFRLGGPIVIAAAWHGTEVSTSGRQQVVSAAEQIKLGGALTLRGFRQEQYSGDRLLWGNHEFRYLVGTNARLFAFVDAGYVRLRSLVSSTSDSITTRTWWPVGYGVGLRAQTRAGLLGIDFGWGRGDQFGEGKVHVRIETAF
jgi:outer membrane protein assembly factor BamA